MLKKSNRQNSIAALKTRFSLNTLISDNKSRMTPQPTQQLASIYFAISAALLFHIFLLLALSYLPDPPKKKELRTVPTVTIRTGSLTSIDNQTNSSASANTIAANAYLATLKASTFTVQQTKNKQNNETRKTLKKSGKTFSATRNRPQLNKPNNQSQLSRANKANEGMRNIFQQKKISNEDKTLISTTDKKELSDYEISLRSTLSRAVLYDQFHSFMEAKEGNEINFEVTLILLPNGAIKNAIISKSSGIAKIDELAKQVAFKVSPYPIPPTEDMQKGFRYTIPITQKGYSD